MTTILSDIGLNQTATGRQTATIAEPSLACSGKRMFVTGNWFAARSTSAGARWKFIDPYTELPPAGAGFCCDQLVLYSKPWRLWVWLLQFAKNTTGNRIRVAVSSTGAPGSWTFWDTTPQDIDPNWRNVWLDYPDMLETDGNLLLSFNLFSTATDHWQRAVVLRFPMATLKARGELQRQAWSTDQFGSLRFARGAGNVAYFASLSYSAPQLQVFRWADNTSAVTQTSVAVSDWADRHYVSPLPDGGSWLNRLDARVTGGWMAEDRLGFAWSAAADADHPHPFIRVVRINRNNMALVDEPDLWSTDRAWAYPAMCPNQRGDVGVTAFCGGGGRFPTHAVGHLDQSSGTWEMTLGQASTHGPGNGAWGDYLDIRPDPSRTTYWLASGFVLQGGASRNHIVPRVVLFKP
ncbi:hypothetical protein [Ketobacter sp.]|uniref:hypothetical protein n=1 Tax=Ketobacter sp. TaxID=2083498 RepID=UPI000F16A9E1|nr:hypothetical protein [Ketobacter sp.]RLT96981.1 MAG: hypothetical protein D9N14_13230 [Ketobacter sp.]